MTEMLIDVQKVWPLNLRRSLGLFCTILLRSLLTQGVVTLVNGFSDCGFFFSQCYLARSLTNASDAKEEASMAKVVFGRLELFGSLEVGQLFTHRASIRQCISGKILFNKDN